MWSIQSKSDSYLLNAHTGQKILTGKYIMELSKQKQLQRWMIYLERTIEIVNASHKYIKS